MEKMKKYIENFLKRKKMNDRYCICTDELFSIKKALKHDMFNAIATTFEYGYVKGYRAAMAEMKKGSTKNG